MEMFNFSIGTEAKGNIHFVTKNEVQQKTGSDTEPVQENGAIVEISDEAKQKYAEMTSALQNLQAGMQQGEAQSVAMKDMGKILEIFRRISQGNKVPAKDEKKLMDYSKELYQAAKMAAMMAKNKKPKKYKSVDDEEEENKTSESSASVSVSEVAESDTEVTVEIAVDSEVSEGE